MAEKENSIPFCEAFILNKISNKNVSIVVQKVGYEYHLVLSTLEEVERRQEISKDLYEHMRKELLLEGGKK